MNVRVALKFTNLLEAFLTMNCRPTLPLRSKTFFNESMYVKAHNRFKSKHRSYQAESKEVPQIKLALFLFFVFLLRLLSKV